MEDARRGLAVILPQRGIALNRFDAAADSQEIARLTPQERTALLERASERVESMRDQLGIGDSVEYTGFFSVHCRHGLRNRISSLEYIRQRYTSACLDALLNGFRAFAEMTRFCEFSFASARMLAGAMPTAQAFLAALGRTNLIQMLAAGGGVSGRQIGSIRSL